MLLMSANVYGDDGRFRTYKLKICSVLVDSGLFKGFNVLG